MGGQASYDYRADYTQRQTSPTRPIIVDREDRMDLAISLDRKTSLLRLKSTSTTATHTRKSRMALLGRLGGGD